MSATRLQKLLVYFAEQAIFFLEWSYIYALLTKRAVKMAGYCWPSSFFLRFSVHKNAKKELMAKRLPKEFRFCGKKAENPDLFIVIHHIIQLYWTQHT